LQGSATKTMNMIDHLIEKGVKKHFNGQIVLFAVASLNEHFEGLQIHDTDIVKIEQWDGDELVGTEEYIKASDVNFDGAVAKEVATTVEETKNEPETGMPFAEADELRKIGQCIALPEWGGFWFGNIHTGELLVLTKEGEITNTPFDEFKERNDWKVVEPTPEQKELLEAYFTSPEIAGKIQIDVTEELLSDNPELVVEGIKVGEIIIVDAQEVKAETVEEKTVTEEILEVPKTPRFKK